MTEQPTLRNRIRRAICEAEGFAWDTDMLEPDEYGDHADAVLAVLPAPADRAAETAQLAAGLRAAADEIAGIDFHPNARARSLDIATGLVRRLRRLADEAQQPEADRQELTATLVIGRSDSHCGGCGKSTLPRNTHHHDISGWTPAPARDAAPAS